jgi:uncharacterized protein (DUF697 family)
VSLEIERYQSTTVTIDLPLENDGRAERERATQLTTRAALTCAAISAEPIPWLDTALVLPIQIKLVVDIGRAYGFTLTRARARSVALELGGAFIYGYASRQFARGIAKITMPVVGGLVTAPVVYASTFTLGNLAERYFRAQRGDLPPLSKEASKEWADSLLNEGKKLAAQLTLQDLRRALEGFGRFRSTIRRR